MQHGSRDEGARNGALSYVVWVQRQAPRIGTRQRIEVTDDGLRVRARLVAADAQWKMLTRVVETKDLVLFFAGRGSAWYLPKRALRGQHDLETLRYLLHQNMGDRARLYR
jgi:hypothetical protein